MLNVSQSPRSAARALALASVLALAPACSEDGPPDRIHGAVEHEHLGWRVAATPDVDGDGISDFAVASGTGFVCPVRPANGSEVAPLSRSRVTLFSGATRQAIFVIGSKTPGEPLGAVIAEVPDMDADGIGDLLLTSPGIQEERSAFARVFSSRTGNELASYEGRIWEQLGGEVSLAHDFDSDDVHDVALFSITAGGDELTILSGVDWRVLARVSSPMQSSDVRLRTAGDVDGDGVGDLVLSDRSDVAVFSGKRLDELARFRPQLDGSTLSIAGATGVGDQNGDGRADIFVTDRSGRGWVYAGADGHLIGRYVPEGSWDEVASVVPGGDVDGDGVPDFAVSYIQYIVAPKQTVVVWSGKEQRPLATFPIEAGRQRDEAFGRSLDLSGDFDGDGRADLLLGISEDSTRASHSGVVRIVTAAEMLAE